MQQTNNFESYLAHEVDKRLSKILRVVSSDKVA
jgi:hypothetical protein